MGKESTDEIEARRAPALTMGFGSERWSYFSPTNNIHHLKTFSTDTVLFFTFSFSNNKYVTLVVIIQTVDYT